MSGLIIRKTFQIGAGPAASGVSNDGATWSSVSNAAVQDGNWATEVLSALGTHGTSVLFQVWDMFTIPTNATVVGIRVGAFLKAEIGNMAELASANVQISHDQGATWLTTAGDTGVQAILSNAGQWYEVGGSNDLWGDSGWVPNSFNQTPHPITIPSKLQVQINPTWKAAGSDGLLSWDGARITVWYTLSGLADDMDNFHAAKEGGFRVISGEAVTISNSSVQMFPNAPASTVMARVTVRTSDITARGDGSAATASTNGVDYYAGGPYDFPFSSAELKRWHGIRTSGSDSVIWAEYWGT